MVRLQIALEFISFVLVDIIPPKTSLNRKEQWLQKSCFARKLLDLHFLEFVCELVLR